ncbi:YybH family protein [Pyxidicoccus caerfyrddinensis]|uniref:YybH family protein n=1 Tax=Pyxidicoccus caerfyrddinensis TaxID=2709663 RepID=UPI0013DBFE66|nr:nuclear transport factor 2 family protein [Pyxidicoccus caerfyrddinensis]
MNLNAKPFLLLGPLLLGASPSPTHAAPRTPAMTQPSPALSPQDEKVLRALMTDLDLRWQQRDVPAYLAHFAEDADFVNRAGTWFRGRAALQQQLQWLVEKGRPEMFAMRTDLEAVRAIAPGVFVVIQHRDEHVRKSRATFVITRSGDALRVQSVSIAPVEPPAGPQAPAR